MGEKMTRDQFIEWAVAFSGGTPTHDGMILAGVAGKAGKRLIAKECFCGADNCHGWAMVSPDQEPIGNTRPPTVFTAKPQLVELPAPNPGNGVREVLIEYFDRREYLRHVLLDAPGPILNRTDHLLALLWERGFKVVPIEETAP